MTKGKLSHIQAPSPLVGALCAEIEKLPLKAVAFDAGVGYQYLSDIRRGKVADPGIRRLEAIAAAVGYDIVLQPRDDRDRIDQ